MPVINTGLLLEHHSIPPETVLEPSSGDLKCSSDSIAFDSPSSGNSEKTANIVGGMKDLNISKLDLQQDSVLLQI